MAAVIEVVLWGVVISGLVVLIWHYRDWLQAFVSRRPTRKQKLSRPLPQQAFGLDLKPESLPDDVAASAEHLWQSNPREALGLLYRALLSRLLHDFNMTLKAADTEPKRWPSNSLNRAFSHAGVLSSSGVLTSGLPSPNR